MGCRSVGDGFWIVPPFNAADFTGAGGMIWTVERGDVTNWAYTRIGNTLVATFAVFNTSVGGTLSNELRIVLPPGLTVARGGMGYVQVVESGAKILAYAGSLSYANYIYIYKFDLSNFAATTNETSLFGQSVLEVL